MKCPNDNVTLVMSERAGVEIDYCPECRGVWLDRGELDKIIQAANTKVQPERRYEQPSQSNHHYEQPAQPDHYKHENHYDQKPKKKESFIGDLFDF